MFRSPTARFAFACAALGVVWGCATAQQPDLGDGEDTTGGTGATSAGGSSGATSTAGSTSSGGHLGSSGSPGASGSSSVAGGTSSGGSTGSAGTSATAGSPSGGTSAAGASSGGASGSGTSSAGSSSTGGSHAGGSTGTAGASATAGSSGVAGSTSSGGSTGAGGAASGTVLFSDDFEDGATDKWAPSGGTWAIVTDGTKAYAQTATGTGSTVILSAAGSTSWTDQVVEARVKVTAFGGSSTSYFAAIYARFNGTDYYSLCLRSDGKIVIRKDKTSLSNAVDATIAENTWYTVKFSVVGSTLNGYLNGTLLATTTDSSLTSGGIAVSTVNTTAEFDDIKVTAP